MSSSGSGTNLSEDIRNDVARLKRLLGLDVNRLAIGQEIEGIVEGGIFGSNDYTITGVNTIEFVNVASDIVYGVQTGATDTTAPGQVTGLNVIPISNTVLNLNWNANSELDLSLYNVYRGTSPGFSVTPGVTTPIGTPSTNSYSDTGRTTSTAYYYKVAAVDTSGNIGSLSTEDSATTFPLPPAQITGLTVTPQGGSNTQLNLAWTASAAPNFAYYNVYRGPTGFTPGSSFRIAQPVTNSYANTALSSGTTYYYKVSAVDTSPQEGLASSQVSGTTTGPSIPAGISLWLKFDGNYNDSSGIGNTVTSFNSSGFVGSGQFGTNSVKLNTPTAGTDHVEVTANTNINIDMAGKWSFSCWIYSTSTNGHFFSKFQSGTSFTLASVYFGDLHFGLTKAGTDFGKTSGSLPLNTWHHVVGTWDGATNTMMLYLDKVSQTSTFAGGIAVQNTNLMIGGSIIAGSRSDEFEGRIDEFQLYKGLILTQTQVNNLYNTNFP